MLQNLLQKHPTIFCLLVSLLFAGTMYLGSILSLKFNATNLFALSLAGGVLGLVIAIEILIIKTQRQLKTLQLCTGTIGGGITALSIQTSLTAAAIGAGIGLLLAITANKRLYTMQ